MTVPAGQAAPGASAAETLLGPALKRDPSGRSWLPTLLAAAPRARESLGALIDQPGALQFDLAVRGASGRLAAFERRVPAPTSLLAWFVEHPEALRDPGADSPPETRRLRRLLLDDDPPGARARAQSRARELLDATSPYTSEWWRFEDSSTPECVLITDRLVITVQTSESDPLAPATAWFPQRARLVRTLEAAGMLAAGRRFGSLLVADQPPESAIEELVRAGTPHLDVVARELLCSAFLGTVGWAAAGAAVGV